MDIWTGLYLAVTLSGFVVVVLVTIAVSAISITLVVMRVIIPLIGLILDHWEKLTSRGKTT